MVATLPFVEQFPVEKRRQAVELFYEKSGDFPERTRAFVPDEDVFDTDGYECCILGYLMHDDVNRYLEGDGGYVPLACQVVATYVHGPIDPQWLKDKHPVVFKAVETFIDDFDAMKLQREDVELAFGLEPTVS